MSDTAKPADGDAHAEGEIDDGTFFIWHAAADVGEFDKVAGIVSVVKAQSEWWALHPLRFKKPREGGGPSQWHFTYIAGNYQTGLGKDKFKQDAEARFGTMPEYWDHSVSQL